MAPSYPSQFHSSTQRYNKRSLNGKSDRAHRAPAQAENASEVTTRVLQVQDEAHQGVTRSQK